MLSLQGAVLKDNAELTSLREQFLAGFPLTAECKLKGRSKCKIMAGPALEALHLMAKAFRYKELSVQDFDAGSWYMFGYQTHTPRMRSVCTEPANAATLNVFEQGSVQIIMVNYALWLSHCANVSKRDKKDVTDKMLTFAFQSCRLEGFKPYYVELVSPCVLYIPPGFLIARKATGDIVTFGFRRCIALNSLAVVPSLEAILDVAGEFDGRKQVKTQDSVAS